jgi:hypothetical protein
MVSVGLRTAFNEHLFGEPEQDANTALTELDKGNQHVNMFQLVGNFHLNFTAWK